MKNTGTILKLILSVCLICSATTSLRAQSSIQEMIDKGKDLMIAGKNDDALVQFNNALALDPKLIDMLKPYIDRLKPKPSAKSGASSFKINQGRLIFNGIPDEQIVTVDCQKGEWEVESLEEWCKVISADKFFKEVLISCSPNFTGRERKCLVYFTNDRGNGSITELPLQIRQKSETEVLEIKDGYVWRDPEKPNFLHLEATGDLVLVDLVCNTQWQVLHKPDGVEVSDDNGDMSKLVIRIVPKKTFVRAQKFANTVFGAIEKDYITIATVNQDVRLTIQTEKDKLGKSDEEKIEKRERRKSGEGHGSSGISDKTEVVEKGGEMVETVETR